MNNANIKANIASTLNSSDLAILKDQISQIGAAAQTSTLNNKFIYFAAFDGTNNDRENIALSGAPLQTNVSEIQRQFQEASQADGNNNFRSGYYPGPGTGGINGSFAARSFDPTPAIEAAAEKALNDFAIAAAHWLAENPDRTANDITASAIGFSRGCGTAIVFAQLLNERGLVTADGTVLVLPGQLSVISPVLLDPVFTGISRNLTIPPNVKGSVLVVQALDEFRYMCRAADLSNDSRVSLIQIFGNHGNIGGLYDNGIGALVLEGITGFFRNSGFTIFDVRESRRFDPTAPVNIYTEGVDSYGNRIWDEYGTRGNRLLQRVPAPVLPNGEDPRVGLVHAETVSPSDERAGTTLVTLITQASARNTISFGKGIAWADLTLRQSGNDLVLDAGAGDSITFKNWYIGSAWRTTTTLQFLREESGDTTLNHQVETFDFAQLVSTFDTERATRPLLGQPINRWALTHSLLKAHLASSDSAALGGELAWHYAQTGSFTGIGSASAQRTLGAPEFGTSAQLMSPPIGAASGMDVKFGM